MFLLSPRNRKNTTQKRKQTVSRGTNRVHDPEKRKMKIYVGNMPYAMTEDELRSVFEAHGNVASASLAIDRETRRPRGFGFVEMPDAAEANAAIAALNGTEQGGRKLVVNEARPREDRPRGPRSFGGRERGGFGNRSFRE